MRALISVWDKTGIAELAGRLAAAGIELISTGGTYRAIADAGVPVRQVEDVTGFPEIIDGRVKTLHPAIHGGLLARQDLPEHLDALREHGIEPIHLLVVNLYPFGDVVRQPDTTLEMALEHIDIGGPAMLWAAAKNFPSIIVVVDPADYEVLAQSIRKEGISGVSMERRRALAAKAFAHVAAYDSVIASYLNDNPFPENLTVSGQKMTDLRYGENPHQAAALYRINTPSPSAGTAAWRVLGGKEMSFNNYLDAQAAVDAVRDLSEPAVAIIKHNVPCGIAQGPSLDCAFNGALASDPVSAFGGVVAMNRELDDETARLIAARYFEVVLAPSYHASALETLTKKKNLRVIEASVEPATEVVELRLLDGAFLAQTSDRFEAQPGEWRCVTQRAPSPDELKQLVFAWTVVRHVKSNAIVLAKHGATVGIGGGQPNRVDAVRIAIERAADRSAGSVLASDAFFPFADNIEVAAAGKVTAIVQPGGSVRDDEVIAAADAAGIAMVFTGERHFRH